MIMGSGMEAVALGSEAFAMGSFFFQVFHVPQWCCVLWGLKFFHDAFSMPRGFIDSL